MKKCILASVILSSSAFAQATSGNAPVNAPAGKIALQGSDTLAGFVTDVVVASGLEEQVVYQGGGSGKGEEAIIAGLQGLAPMSRQMKPDALATAQKAGIEITEHMIGLDGVGLFVNQANTAKALNFDQIKDIFSCKVTNWKDVGGADEKIVVYRRDDLSGTTDTFKSLTGLAAFGSCVTIVKETDDIAVHTATEAGAVGYAGLSATRPENHPVAVSVSAEQQAYLPNVANIRSFKYPLARKLYVYEASGAYVQKAAETQLLQNLIDRSFADPILIDHDFFTID